MVFNSVAFLLFLPTVLLLYYLMPHKWRWTVLLAASYFFYGFWKVEYLLLILLSTTVDYFVANYLANNHLDVKRKIALSISLAVNLGLLFFFKYSNWFIDDVMAPTGVISEDLVEKIHRNIQFLLPVGISFYTFQTLSYTIDVYYRKAIPEKNFFRFALFVSYFPQLVAGPIERFNHLHKQLFEKHRFSYQQLQHGGRLILYGLFIKMCVADNVGMLTDQIFNDVTHSSSIQLISGLILFSIQIFSDFHGYSLIAIGTARLFGVELMDNFNSPYRALSIREFWSRWHISLSTWFRDYVFIPLGGSRVSKARTHLNIMLVFAISGLWHGADWTFIIWGCIHGFAYVLESISLDKIKSQHAGIKAFKWLFTITIVLLAWPFFRAHSLNESITYLGNMLTNSGSGIVLDYHPIIISFVGLFLISDFTFKKGNFHSWCENQGSAIRWTVYLFMVFSIMAYSGTVQHPFIYFQF